MSGPTIVMPEQGRGAWSSSGKGGTLSTTGHSRGAFYAASDGTLPLVGLAAARAVRAGQPVALDDYAVHRAVVGWQRLADVAQDGIYGADTAAGVKSLQKAAKLTSDGVVGPVTARALLTPVADDAARRAAPSAVANDAALLVRGHVSVESLWDVGAVGVSTPDDVGLGQINGPSHESMSLDERLDPFVALDYVASLVASNLVAFPGDVDGAIAAYNLGQGGARTWIKAGRPAVWQRLVAGVRTSVYVRRYIDSVRNAGSV